MVGIQTISLRSSNLQETRGLTIFLPEGYRPGTSTPVVSHTVTGTAGSVSLTGSAHLIQ
jgi:hypothetical protein